MLLREWAVLEFSIWHFTPFLTLNRLLVAEGQFVMIETRHLRTIPIASHANTTKKINVKYVAVQLILVSGLSFDGMDAR